MFPKTKHVVSEGIRAEINNNLSERLQGTYRDREKTLRGLDGRASGQRYFTGLTLTYNFFREHESLDERTPAEAAKVKAPYGEWADVVASGRHGTLRPVRVQDKPKAAVVAPPTPPASVQSPPKASKAAKDVPKPTPPRATPQPRADTSPSRGKVRRTRDKPPWLKPGRSERAVLNGWAHIWADQQVLPA